MLLIDLCTNLSQKSILETLMPLLASILTAFLVYFFGIKGKKKDIINEQLKELNIVLSNMLNTRYYLQRLNEVVKIFNDTSDNLILPKKYVPYFTLTSGILNDNCFNQLDDSVEKLKAYDPITYYNLEGIGTRVDFFKSNFIIPFLKSSKENSSPFNNISSLMLDDLSNELDNYLRKTSKLISKKIHDEVENIITNNYFINVGEIIEQYNKEYYYIILKLMKRDDKEISYEQFKKEFKTPQKQENLKREFEFIQNKGIEKMVEIISANPDLTMEELEKKIEKDEEQNKAF